MRSTLRRSVLAAGGTLLAASLARKYLAEGAAAEADPAHPPVQPLDVVTPHAARPLPPLSFQELDGKPLTLDGLRARHPGRGLVLNLWATWCVPCVAELPALDALARALAPAGIAVTAVSIDHGGAASVKPFLAAHAIRALPVLLDPHSGSLAALGVDGVPETLLIDANGAEVARIPGSVDWADERAAALVTRIIAGGA